MQLGPQEASNIDRAKRALRGCLNEFSSSATPCGPLIDKLLFPAVHGPDVEMYYSNPMAYLWKACQENP
eukprot:8187106-Pyramimonas_sp.AAC.1